MNDLGPPLASLIEALDRSGIRYMIGGSLASGIHGIYRTSLDVDLVADIGVTQITRLIRELGGEFYADADTMRDALLAGRPFNLIHYATSYKFDIFPLEPDAFQQEQFSRRVIREVVLSGNTIAVPVSTPEDTVLMKLVWYRSGGEVSERQWNDIPGIIGVQRNSLDRAYLGRWAAYLKVIDLLEQALAMDR